MVCKWSAVVEGGWRAGSRRLSGGPGGGFEKMDYDRRNPLLRP
jgi:hypothetical protein